MKKWVFGLVATILLLLCSIYVFIPTVVSLNANIEMKAASPAVHRMLLDKNNLSRWWPGKINRDSLFMEGFIYIINAGNITVMPIMVTGQKIDLTTSLYLISNRPDSTVLHWVGTMVTSYNPLARLFNYRKARKINRDMVSILEKMKAFYSNPENIYGIKIKKTYIVDSFLIATSGTSKGYPTNDFIYGLVNKLRRYATINSSKESGYPMLNISTADSTNFEIKVALPIDKSLPSSGDILQKRMPGGNIILVTEVKGGLDSNNMAFEQIQRYSIDHHIAFAAIPFYSLVTDRLKEPDTNKWQTKIYCPVMIYGRDLN